MPRPPERSSDSGSWGPASCGIVWVCTYSAPSIDRSREKSSSSSRGDSGRQQDYVGDALGDRRQRRVARLDQRELCVDVFLDHASERGRLAQIRFEGEDQRHRLGSYVATVVGGFSIVCGKLFLNMKSTSTAPTVAKITSGAFSMLW